MHLSDVPRKASRERLGDTWRIFDDPRLDGPLLLRTGSTCPQGNVMGIQWITVEEEKGRICVGSFDVDDVPVCQSK